MNTLASVEDGFLDIDGSCIATLRRRSLVPTGADAPRLLCLHGWLDNANSFAPLMPLLPQADIVAIDLPGHGHSAALAGGYSLAEMVYRTRRIIQELEWPDCHLVGHSLGGCIVPMLAVAAPDVVQSVSMIEASGPLTEEADKLPARLQRSLDDRLDVQRYVSRTFPDKETAIAARLKAATMAYESARQIIERQLIAVAGGWQWRFDPRWRLASTQYQTEAQVRAVLAAIRKPTLTILADAGFLSRRDDTEIRLSNLLDRTSVTLPGNHHLHMDDPEPVARHLNKFLATH